MMETVPDDLLTYQHLSRLSLVDESIATLPEDMGALYKLKLLRLDSNLLTGLPASLARLSVLTALHVNHNRLSKIQECVWLLGALQVAFSPFIRAAPPSAAALRGRCSQVLEMSENVIQDLPSKLFALPRLRMLDCSAGCWKYLRAPLATQCSSRGHAAETRRKRSSNARNPSASGSQPPTSPQFVPCSGLFRRHSRLRLSECPTMERYHERAGL